ncbi:hypothetical protein ACSYAD_08820 [Acaryochloris marina NIES-2412]|uniref:hypothetical protein n=1 Tax=Acaryochloris marina TaxID=155978 RepID=UPI0040598A57
MQQSTVHPNISVENRIWSDLDRYCGSFSTVSALALIILAPLTCNSGQFSPKAASVYSGETLHSPVSNHPHPLAKANLSSGRDFQ